MKLKWFGLVFAMMPSFLMADYNVTGSLNATANVNANGGHLYAQQYCQTGAEVNAGTWIYCGTGFSTAGYLSANTYGYFGTTLRVGPGTIAGTGNTYSVVFGLAPTTNSYSSVIFGRYNKDTTYEGNAVTPGSWQPKDPLLVVGNGVDANNKNNAFAVYKDGTITMSKVQGDISMGVFQ